MEKHLALVWFPVTAYINKLQPVTNGLQLRKHDPTSQTYSDL